MTDRNVRTDGGGEASPSRPFGGAFDPEELRRRNAISVGMDVLYLLTTGFFALMFTRGLAVAVIAAVPMAMLLYFGWNSSRAFFVAQVLAIVLTIAVALAGIVPL